MLNRLEKIRYYANVIQKASKLMKEEINQLEEEGFDLDIDQIIQPKTTAPIKPQVILEEMPVRIEEPAPQAEVKTIQAPKEIQTHEQDDVYIARQKHVQDILAIDVWPEAVPKHLEVAATNEDQINRANAMLDAMINREVAGSNFLDFGCGDGWVARQALARGATSVTGYDIVASNKWNECKEVQFTNVYKDVAQQSYDIVMLYDVLDHCQDPEQVMKQIRSVIKKDGTLFIRCHPWTSKHASHLYKKNLNKAFIHLFLTWEELVEAGYTPEFTRQEKDPLTAYYWWFESNNFKVVQEQPYKNKIHEFFFSGDFKQLIQQEQQVEDIEKFFGLMEYEFIDFQCIPQ